MLGGPAFPSTTTKKGTGPSPVTSVHTRIGDVVSAPNDYTGSQVTNVPAGTVVATDGQAAINELDTKKVAKAGDSMDSAANLTFSGGGEPLGLPLVPTTDGSGTSKAFVNALLSGLDVKQSCKLASDPNANWTGAATANFVTGTGVLTISSLTAGASLGLIDAIEPVAPNRILLKDLETLSAVTTDGGAEGTPKKYNGLWAVTGGTTTTLTLERTDDADSDAEVTSGLFTFIEDGTASGDGFVIVTQDPIIVNTTAITFSQFSKPLGTVTKIGTPADNQVGVWTGDGTLEGTTGLTFSAGVFSASNSVVATSGALRATHSLAPTRWAQLNSGHDSTTIPSMTFGPAVTLFRISKEVDIVATQTTGIGLGVTSDGLTSGKIARFSSNSPNASARNLVEIINDHTGAINTTLLSLQQDALVSTNFQKILNLGGSVIWRSDGTNPDTVLSGTAGDLCLNGASNQTFYSTGGTGWSLLGSAATAEEDVFTPTLSQTVFALSATPASAKGFKLFLNGIFYVRGTAYTQAGTVLTWLNPGGLTLVTTDALVANYES